MGEGLIGYKSKEGQMDYFNDQYNFLFSLDFSKLNIMCHQSLECDSSLLLLVYAICQLLLFPPKSIVFS